MLTTRTATSSSSARPILSHSPSSYTYTHQADIERKLEKQFTPDNEEKVLRSPAMLTLLFHGFVKYSNESNQPFPADHLFTHNELFRMATPEADADSNGLPPLVRFSITLSEDSSETTNEILEFPSQAKFESFKSTLQYIKSPSPKIVAKLLYTPKDAGAIEVLKLVNDHVLLRIQRIAKEPIQALKELNLVGTCKFERTDGVVNAAEMPYGLKTTITVNKPLEQVRELMNQVRLLKNIFPGTESASRQEGTLSDGDSFRVKMKTISTSGGLVEEDVDFYVRKGDDHLLLTSSPRVAHFHQLAYEIILKDGKNNDTDIELQLYFSSSNLVNIASTFMSALKYVPIKSVSSKAVDISLLMYMRARNILEASIRLVHRYSEGLVDNI